MARRPQRNVNPRHHVYTSQEYADMHFMYGLANGSNPLALTYYQDRYEDRGRRIPALQTFSLLHNRLAMTGCVFTHTRERGCTAMSDEARADLEETIIREIERSPWISTRDLSLRTGAPYFDVWQVLSDEGMHPYHFLHVQQLLPDDYESRRNFSEWILHHRNLAPNILYTDESQFTRHGISNIHNEHLWMRENPREIKQRSFQERFHLNVWLGVCGGTLLGPHFFNGTLTAPIYSNFLRDDLPLLSENLPLAVRRDLIYQHDGAPAHRAAAVTNHLNAYFRGRWIGNNGGLVRWPPRSPDLTPLDFSIWGRLKAYVYDEEMRNVNQLREKIVRGCNEIRAGEGVLWETTNSVLSRATLCLENNGGHFQNYL